MMIAVHRVVVEFRMLARPLEMRSSPQALATQGMIALVTAMNANEPRRVLQPGPISGRPIAFTITASPSKPDAERRSSSTVGLMSCTATLIKRKDTPQMRASAAIAKYGLSERLSDTGRPLVRGEHQRHRAVVFDAHPHVSSKTPRLGLYSAGAKLLDEDLVELLRALRVACFQQARTPAAAHVRKKRELRHDQGGSTHVDQAEVHPALSVRKHAEVDELVRQAPHARLVVIRCRTYQQHVAGPDSCTVLRSFVVPGHRARADALGDDSQTFGPKCGSACTSESMYRNRS